MDKNFKLNQEFSFEKEKKFLEKSMKIISPYLINKQD